MFQIQDLLISETVNINEALIAHAAIAVMQSTTARVGMFTKSRHDFKSGTRWEHDNPLRVRDVMHKVKKLLFKNTSGACAGKATTQMQFNWRRVKAQYFEVYLFRSAVTANAVSSVRRTTTVLKALAMRLGRYRACRAGLTVAQLKAHVAQLKEFGYIRLRDSVFQAGGLCTMRVRRTCGGTMTK